MNNEKYELLMEDSIEFYGITLYRIKALRDISTTYGRVKRGDLGGYVQSKYNLSNKGNCWIYGDAKVYEGATLNDDAHVYGYAKIHGKSDMWNNAAAGSNAEITGNCQIYDNAFLYDNVIVGGNSKIYGNAKIINNALIRENAEIFGDARITDNTFVKNNAKISGNALLIGEATIGIDADIKSINDYITISPINNNVITFYKDSNGKVIVNHRAFNGYIDIFREKICNDENMMLTIRYVEDLLR